MFPELSYWEAMKLYAFEFRSDNYIIKKRKKFEEFYYWLTNIEIN